MRGSGRGGSSSTGCNVDEGTNILRRRLLSSSSCSFAEAVADEIMSSAALANEDVVGISSGGSLGGPLDSLREPSRLPDGVYDEGGPVRVEEVDADNRIPLFVLPRVRVVTVDVDEPSSIWKRTRDANSGVLLAREGPMIGPLPGGIGGGGGIRDPRRVDEVDAARLDGVVMPSVRLARCSTLSFLKAEGPVGDVEVSDCCDCLATPLLAGEVGEEPMIERRVVEARSVFPGVLRVLSMLA